ncbi:carboxypeptidase-like regulatory domain-containing protein [uncultured Chryseobacterium sp.]|uniref:carboxypeptidase-like regulatory domain-containing protein n=1 Tax=uncultured Chryseobacterium sp. TaxID=259322 RepID=UPI0025FD53AF|nr:carboxypeptidase-like regulatory domain-containing protein [uncultured Chryseobacterium sp.]
MITLLVSVNIYSQQATITGTIRDDNNRELANVMVVNMATDQKTATNSDGMFSVQASANDELRFVKKGYERISRRVLANGINSQLVIVMAKLPEEIEEVKVQPLTGDLSKDSRAVARINKAEIVQDAVGLPQPVGKMRERPAEVKHVLLPILVGQLDVQGVYDLISGKARRQKRQYRYDDLQEHILWVRNRVDDDYFIKAGVPLERISEFIEFSFLVKPHVRTYVKARNLSGVLLRMEETLPLYIERLQKK